MSASVSSRPVVTRFAPSPTGYLHIGGARTALFNWLYARHTGGKFLLRIEDTDKARSTTEAIDAILEGMRWLGLDWDGQEYYQSQFWARHAEIAHRLLDDGAAYRCYMTPDELAQQRELAQRERRPFRINSPWREVRDDQGHKPFVIRLKAPREGETVVQDEVQGRVTVQNVELDDFILLRSDGTPTYMLAVVVDDHDMGVTHVIRGDDHLTNTPRQLLLLDALGMRRPGYGHVGLLVGADGAPLSKRHGSTSAQEFRERGFLPAAVLNHLFRLGHTSDIEGWLPVTDMPAHFRPEHLGRAPARFDEIQLAHWQKEGVERMSAAEIGAWLAAGDSADFVELVRHNVVLPADAAPWRAVVRGDLPALGENERNVIEAAGPGFFAAAAAAFDQSSSDLKQLTKILKERTGRKGADLYMPLRVALTGQAHGPELAALLKLMSPETARRRLESHA